MTAHRFRGKKKTLKVKQSDVWEDDQSNCFYSPRRDESLFEVKLKKPAIECHVYIYS